MGGKKKKSAAAQAGTSGAPSAATGKSGVVVAEEANKQLNSNKFTKPAKENKSKGEILVWMCHKFRNNSVCLQRGGDSEWKVLISMLQVFCPGIPDFS